jgi:hypothetical protein
MGDADRRWLGDRWCRAWFGGARRTVDMAIAWGVVMVALSMVGWVGQTLSWLSPATAVRFGMTEAEDTVDPLYHADIRGEARFDTMVMWVMPVAGILLMIGNDAWAYFGLVGGGMYGYFVGRFISTRIELLRRGFRIGDERTIRVGYVAVALWGVLAAITIVAAVVALGSD